MRKRSTRLAAIGLTAVVVLAVVGWVAGRGIRSPAQVAAGVAPPQPSLITVPVVRRKLATEVIVRGTARYGSPQAVILPASTLKSGSELVSQTLLPNARLEEGSVALSVSGRPVFVLRGALPASRDLAPGTEGADVMQLEQALARLGLSPGAIDGRYDGATASAVAAWYRKAGWTPFGPTAGQEDQLRAARAAAATAQDTVLQTQLALQTAARGASPSDVNQVRQDAVSAADGVDSARLALAVASTQVKAALEAAKRVRAAATLVGITVTRDIAAAEADRAAKQAALDAAVDAQVEAQRRVDLPQPDTRVADLAAQNAALQATLQARQAALSVAIDAQTEAQRRVDEPLPDTLADERAARVVALRQAMDTVGVARGGVKAAKSDVAAASAAAAAAVGSVQIAEKEAAFVTARSTLASKEAALSAAIDAQAAAQRRLDEPLVDAAAVKREALRVALRQATDAVVVARGEVTAAATAQAAARRRLGQPPVDTAAARQHLARVALRQATQTASVARRARDAARDVVVAARASATLATMRQAQADVRTTSSDLALAQAQQARARLALATARRHASLADARVSILTGATDTTVQRQIVAAAEAESRRADADVARLATRTGVQIPAGEVLFFPVLPLRVDTVSVRRGEPISGAVMTVSNSRIAIDSSLSINDARLVRVGLPVTIEEQDLRIKLMGTMTRIANAPGTVPTDPQRVYFEVTPASAPQALVGASVRLAIAVSSTSGAVLAVPVSALSVVADGTSRVQVDRGGGRTEFVTVVPGLSAQGLVEVRPVGGRLRVGDLVVVGVGAGASALTTPGGVGSGTTTVPAASTTPAPAATTTTAGNAH